MNFEEQLRDALHQDSEQLVVVGTGTESVKRRAHRRRNRSRAGIATLAAAGVVGSAVAVAQLRPDETATVAVQPSTTATPLVFSWRTVAGSVSSAGQVATAEGVTYVLGTAPGPADPNATDPDKSIYRSVDGVEWTSVPLGANKWISDLSERDGVLYGVGTGPGAGNAVTSRFAVSNDNGKTWTPNDPPISITPPAANVPMSSSTRAFGASGEQGTVVAASASFSPMVENALGNLGKDRSYNIVAEGVQITDMSQCHKADGEQALIDATGSPDATKRFLAKGCNEPPVIETKPWSDFGITDPAALHATQIMIAEGAEWREVPSPLPPGTSLVGMHATANGFVLAGSTISTQPGGSMVTRLYTSPDGEHWTELPALPAGYSVMSSYRDTIVAGDWSEAGNIMVSTDAGVSWNTTNAAALGLNQRQYGFMVAGPLGIAVSFPDYAGMEQGAGRHDALAFSADGQNWQTVDLADFGAPKNGYINNVRVGADHVEAVYSIADPAGQKPATLVTLLATPTAP